MRNSLTASERRGIIVVAVLALLLTLSGWFVSKCQRQHMEETPPEVEVLIHGDSISETDSTTVRKKRTRKSKNDSVKKKKGKTPKYYRRRSPRDEAV